MRRPVLLIALGVVLSLVSSGCIGPGTEPMLTRSVTTTGGEPSVDTAATGPCPKQVEGATGRIPQPAVLWPGSPGFERGVVTITADPAHPDCSALVAPVTCDQGFPWVTGASPDALFVASGAVRLVRGQASVILPAEAGDVVEFHQLGYEVYDFTGQLLGTSWLVNGIRSCAHQDVLAGTSVGAFESPAADKVGTKVLNGVVMTDTRVIRLTFDGAPWSAKERDRVAALAIPRLRDLE